LPRAIFHTLVHIRQLALIGPERVLEAYLRTLNGQGLWAVVPFEEPAYQLDARYTGNPADCFSVEEEVREWLRRDGMIKNSHVHWGAQSGKRTTPSQ